MKHLNPILVTGLMASLLLAPAALACDSHVAEVENTALAVKNVMTERRAVQTRFDEADFQRARLREEAEARGNPDAFRDDIDRYAAEMRTAETSWLERTPGWEAAEAELLKAVAAHEGACGANARTRELMDSYGLKLTR